MRSILLLLMLFLSFYAGCGGTATGTVAGDLAGAPPPATSPIPSTGLRTAVFGTLDDPKVSSILRLAPSLEGAPDPARHDVLVVAANPDVQGNPPIEAFLAAGKTVLLLNPGAATKLQLSAVATRSASRVFAVRRGVDSFGRSHVAVLDWPPAPKDADAGAFEQLLGTYLKSSPSNGGFNPPSGLIYSTYQYYFNPGNPPTFNETQEGKVRFDTPQIPSVTAVYTFRIFLDNADVNGSFQFVSVQADINATPFGTQGKDGLLIEDPGGFFSHSDIGWFQIGLENRIQPANLDLFQWINDGPPNQNNVTSVTTDASFTIGFLNPERSLFQFSNSETRQLTSWNVTNKGANTIGRWHYLNQDPYQADDVAKWQEGGFGGGYEGSSLARGSSFRKPNPLSATQLQVATQVVWATKGLLNTVQDFDCEMALLYANVWSDRSELDNTIAVFKYPFTFSVNMATVIPVTISALTFNPNPVRPAQTTSVVGTITLAGPVPEDITIQLSSNIQNATVLPSVKVLKGQSSANFQVLVNSNGLAPGQSIVATITAFYAQNFQAQLTIQN